MSDRNLSPYVALLRGINVGGNNTVSMAELKNCLEKLGYADVTTYINSGNVIFRTTKTDPRTLEVHIEKALHAHFSFPIKVVVRSFSEMEKTLLYLPQAWQNPSGLRCNVIFLRHTIDDQKILEMLELNDDVEQVWYAPGVIYWSTKLHDLTRSRLHKVLAKPIYKDMTIRILNTVRKIYFLMEELDTR